MVTEKKHEMKDDRDPPLTPILDLAQLAESALGSTPPAVDAKGVLHCKRCDHAEAGGDLALVQKAESAFSGRALSPPSSPRLPCAATALVAWAPAALAAAGEPPKAAPQALVAAARPLEASLVLATTRTSWRSQLPMERQVVACDEFRAVAAAARSAQLLRARGA